MNERSTSFATTTMSTVSYFNKAKNIGVINATFNANASGTDGEHSPGVEARKRKLIDYQPYSSCTSTLPQEPCTTQTSDTLHHCASLELARPSSFESRTGMGS